MGGSAGRPVLALRNASKTFLGQRALDRVDLELQAGEIHGLVGHNGSGKSTLVKILAGYHVPDPGCVLELRGRRIDLPLRPDDPARLGLAFVHQQLGLVEKASTLENVLIAGFPTTRILGRIDTRRARRLAARALERVGLGTRVVDVAAGSLSTVEQATVVIARAMHQLAGFSEAVLVLDEPTAYLPQDGIERLFEVIRDAAEAGVTVLFVGHELTEVRAISDRVTVLRDGGRIACRPSRELTNEELAALVLGFRPDEYYPESREPSADVTLEIRDLCADGCRGISFAAHQGEVVGITGLVGSGYERLPYALFGALPASGTLQVAGEEVDLAGLTPARAIRSGIGLVPGQRETLGGVPAASALENLTLVTLGKMIGRMGRIRRRRERQLVADAMDDFDIEPREPQQPFATFSGGNQQKLMLAKWLTANLSILLLHEPTQGVDVGSRRRILGRLRETANAGGTVIIASAEYEDLAHVCDRVLVLRGGTVGTELNGESASDAGILKQCIVLSTEDGGQRRGGES